MQYLDNFSLSDDISIINETIEFSSSSTPDQADYIYQVQYHIPYLQFMYIAILLWTVILIIQLAIKIYTKK